MHLSVALILALSHLTLAKVIDDRWQVGQSVQTQSGLVKGHEASTSSGVSEYLGIKFAETPSGTRRFLAPERYTSNETYSADNFSVDCPSLTLLASNGTSIGDDCLSVNVWTKPQVGEKAKAVLVWIYGGGFSTGGSSDPRTNGAQLATGQDVVVASINYRTNIFGFPGSPDVPDANPGLLDQRLGVEWVRDNIAAFGGDPERIVIFGQSAGAASVNYYSFIWTEDPIVKGFISDSGSALIAGPFASEPLTNRHKSWFNVSSTLGCGGSEAGSSTVACVQNKTALQILKAMPNEVGLAQITGDFGPTFDNKTVFYDYQERTKNGNYIKKPMLAGANSNESTLFNFLAQSVGEALNQSTLDGIQNGFNCPQDFLASNKVQQGVNAWRYFFLGDFTNNEAIPGLDLGAFHAAEIPFIFNTTSLSSNQSDTPGEAQLILVLQNAWGSFARDPENGLLDFGWPLYQSPGNTLIRLGFEGSGVPDFVNSTMYDTTCTPDSIAS